MPSPAVDTKTSVAHSNVYDMTRSWVITDPVTFRTTVTQTTQARRNPATVVNKPINGVRPMSGWFKRWHFGNQQPSSFSGTLKEGSSVTTYDFKNYCCYQLLPADIMSASYWDLVGRQYPFTPSLAFSADNGARTNVLGKLSQKKWDLGVTAGELRQTAGLVTDLASGMAHTVERLINTRHSMRQVVDNFFREVRRQGSFDKAAASVGLTDIGLLNYLKDSWMQYQFGVKPLLNDVSSAVDWLSSQQQAGQKMIVRAKAGSSQSRSFVGPNLSAHGQFTARARMKEDCQVHYSVAYEIPNGQVRAITSLGLDNPWSVAWELTQLSWMVDYVVGVGSWLNSFTATKGMIFSEGCVSTLKRLASTELIIEPNGAFKFDKRPIDTGFYVERGEFTREILQSGVTPAVMPQIRSTLGLTQLGNSLFALSDVFSGRRVYR